MEIWIELSKKGIPCLWEEGGGRTNTGTAIIICGPDGKPTKPLYIRRRGSLACEKHALIPIAEGDLVVEASHHRGDFWVRVNQITRIDKGGDTPTACCSRLYYYDQGEWDNDPPPWLEAVIEAAKGKATCYHCREPHYIAS